ncbi:MAG: pentapeptide repeat-containing protein [Catenulispora sp.]
MGIFGPKRWRNKDLTGANLHGENLSRADLTGANLAGANLTGANLTRAKLGGANLTRAKLDGANLTHADLTGADLTGAYLPDTILTGAQLHDATLTSIAYTSNTRWPDGFNPKQQKQPRSVAVFTYAMQVQQANGDWSVLRDAGTGGVPEEFLGVVEVSGDSELVSAAEQVMARRPEIVPTKRRVAFFSGDHRGKVLRPEDVYAIPPQDVYGTVTQGGRKLVRWPQANPTVVIPNHDGTMPEDDARRADALADDAAVRELVRIGQQRSFLNATGYPNDDEPAVAIGHQLNKKGGAALMRAVHVAVARQLHDIPGRARELEAAWHGIGEWRY